MENKLLRVISDISSVGFYTEYQMHKAKKAHVKKYSECAICGNRKYLEVHHIKPVHVYPHLACSETNFITLCDPKNNGCHRHLGHYSNFRSKYNTHIRELSYVCRTMLENGGDEREFLMTSEQMLEHYCNMLNESPVEFLKRCKSF